MHRALFFAVLACFPAFVAGCVPTSDGLLGPTGSNGPVDFPVWNGTDDQTQVAGTGDEAGTNTDTGTDTTTADTTDPAGRTENQGGSSLAQARQIIADDRWDLLNPDDVQLLTDLVISAHDLSNAAITDEQAAAFVAMLDKYDVSTQRLFENVVQTNAKFPVLVPISAEEQPAVDLLADTERLETTLVDAAAT